MNIQNIHPLPGQLSAVHATAEGNAALPRRTVSMSMPIQSAALSGKQETSPGDSDKVTALINNLQRDLESDPSVVLYPPFFPIATYQRLNLIEKVRGIEEAIVQASLDESQTSAISANFLKNHATDGEISAALGKLFALRDQWLETGQASPAELQPGSILSTEA